MKSVGKLANFFEQELKTNLKDLIIPYPNNRYELFGRFRIESKDQLFVITDSKTKQSIRLSSLKNAVLYCTLASVGKHMESRRIENLDLKLMSLQVDMAIHKKMLKSAVDDDAKFIYINKLQEAAYRKKILNAEVTGYINSSKRILEFKLSQNFN